MIQRLYRQIGPGKYLLLWGITLLFGMSERASGPSTLFAHILAVLNDQYYAVFAILPIFLFICGSVMEDDTELVILRYKNYGRYFWAKWFSLAVLSGGLWLGQMALLALTGSGLLLSHGWPMLNGNDPWKEVFTLLAAHFQIRGQHF